MMKLKLAAFASAALLAAPASATLVRYDVAAGGAGASWGENSLYLCTSATPGGSQSCGTTMNATDANFSLTGRFIVDTDQLPNDTDNNPNRMYFDRSGTSFLTASMTKTGGTMALPTLTSDGGDRSIMYTNGSTYQLYGQTSASHGWQYEYHSNGRVARQYTRDQFIDIFLYTPGITTSVIDGRDFATAFGPFNINSALRSFDRITEYTYDTSGRQITYSMATKYVYGRIQSINAAPVPEPAALALFGLGAAAVGLRRRRRMT